MTNEIPPKHKPMTPMERAKMKSFTTGFVAGMGLFGTFVTIIERVNKPRDDKERER